MSIRSVQPSTLSAEAQREQFQHLCQWIQANADMNMGWTQLMEISGWSHKELINLFMYFVQTTPMAYVKTIREGARPSSVPLPRVLPKPLIR